MFLAWLKYGIDVLKALSSGLETVIANWPKKPVDPNANSGGAARVVPLPKEEKAGTVDNTSTAVQV